MADDSLTNQAYAKDQSGQLVATVAVPQDPAAVLAQLQAELAAATARQTAATQAQADAATEVARVQAQIDHIHGLGF